jgi:hypothetical protein
LSCFEGRFDEGIVVDLLVERECFVNEEMLRVGEKGLMLMLEGFFFIMMDLNRDYLFIYLGE